MMVMVIAELCQGHKSSSKVMNSTCHCHFHSHRQSTGILLLTVVKQNHLIE
jgi:hypothetical protein